MPRKRRSDPELVEEGESQDSSPESSHRSTGTGSDASGPFKLERSDFDPGEEQPPLENAEDDFEPPPPELIVWTPERAGFLLRAAGAVLHAADGASHAPIATHVDKPAPGETCGCDACELWRMTQRDLDGMGPPLANILNRYAVARRLAGYSDEGALAFEMLAYAKRNLTARGRIVAEQAAEEAVVEPPAWEPPEPSAEGWGEGTA